MDIRSSLWIGAALLALLVPVAAPAQQEAKEWDRARVAALTGELHETVAGLKAETQSRTRDVGTMQAAAYYRLLDNLRLLDRETRHIHGALEAGASREETLPTYARIAMLRRDCAEEMRRQLLAAPVRERLEDARSIVKEMDPYYGFDPERPDHERVLRSSGE